MCRLKYYTISEKFGWHLAAVTAFMFLILGAIGFGYGLKLMEYAEKKDLTPIFAGVPMLLTGVLGVGVALSKKKCIVTSYAIMCVVISMLSIHMNYRFMVKEFHSIPLYKRQCKLSQPNHQQHCNQYAGTVILCCVSVSMLPVAAAAFLACLVAHRSLKKKTCYLIWFTFAKVEPVRHRSKRQTRDKRNNNKSIALIKYPEPVERIGEIPETIPQSEYLPQIPDFMELAVHNVNPAFRDSLMLENEEEYSVHGGRKKTKKHYSKSLENLEQNRSQGGMNNKEFRGSGSNVLSSRKHNTTFDQRWKEKGMESRLAHSDFDLRLMEQDYLNRKNNRENSEYYDSAAEDWIHKMVDNFQNSRSRLYGVSDEEDLESDGECASYDKVNDAGISTTKPLLSKENKNNGGKALDSKVDAAYKPLLSTKETKDNDESVSVVNKTVNIDHGLSTNAHSPPHQNLDTPNNTSYFEENEKKELSRKRVNGVSCSVDIEHENEVQRDDDTEADSKLNISSAVVENFKKDLTPPGLTTPMAGYYSPDGYLHFEFDKPPSATTEHARKNWIEFEGEESKKKLIQGEMNASEYNDLTSYVM